eukprot:Selendium_serpulae@DN3429_c0_g1_i1.p1
MIGYVPTPDEIPNFRDLADVIPNMKKGLILRGGKPSIDSVNSVLFLKLNIRTIIDLREQKLSEREEIEAREAVFNFYELCEEEVQPSGSADSPSSNTESVCENFARPSTPSTCTSMEDALMEEDDTRRLYICDTLGTKASKDHIWSLVSPWLVTKACINRVVLGRSLKQSYCNDVIGKLELEETYMTILEKGQLP